MSASPRLAVSPEDVAAARERLARTGRTRLPLLLGDQTSRTLYQALQNPDLPWKRAFDSPMQADICAAVFDATSREDQAGFMQTIHDQAVDQFQYLFDRLPLLTAPGADRPLPDDLYQLMDWFNGPSFMAFARQLTGNDRISFADGQVTRYLPGHFLNRHSDENRHSGRLYAYVLNLSPDWRAEWGGLLQFMDGAGEITETFVPGFATLNVFAVPQMHAVSTVAAFAGGPRYSITGWWRAVPVVL